MSGPATPTSRRPSAGQLQLWAGPAEEVRDYRACGHTLHAREEVFSAYWRFAAERQAIFHRRAAGAPPPWTGDPILGRYKFTNVYRSCDRTSQALISSVIYAVPAASVQDVVFRVLLFKTFNSERTWQLLQREAGPISWGSYSFAAYDQVLTAARARGERTYSPAYIIPDPPFGEACKHRNHLRLLEHMMATGLPAKIAAAADLRAAYRTLLGYPSIGPFLGYQFAIDLAYSPVLDADENSYVVPGPGALDGIAKCFAGTGGLPPADVIRWIADTAPEHLAERGLEFRDLWGRAPTLIDWQNVLCEIAKYTRVSHPHICGTSGRSRIKHEFIPWPRPVDYRFPPKWGLPPSRTAGSTPAAAGA